MADSPLPVPAWNSFAQGLPPDLPDTAYDALREKFYREQVAPEMLRQGYGYETAREKFMEKTERPGKSVWPRLGVAATTAAEAFSAPLAGLEDKTPPLHRQIQQAAREASREASRQGISPAPYQMLGEMVGQLPYFAAGLEATAAIKAPALIHKGLMTAAGAAVQGAYDAAKAPDGRGFIEGLKGAAMGGAMIGGFEFAGPLWRFLAGRGLPEDAAKATARVAQGLGDESDHLEATKALLADPNVKSNVGEWLSAQVLNAKKAGVPIDAFSELPNGRLKIQMTGADGKPYNLGGAVGVKLEDLNAVLDRMSGHLEKGGSIDRVGGDPQAVRQFLNMLQVANAPDFDLQVPLRRLKPGVPEQPATVIAPSEGVTSSIIEGPQVGAAPTPSAPVANDFVTSVEQRIAAGEYVGRAEMRKYAEMTGQRFSIGRRGFLKFLGAGAAKVPDQEAQAAYAPTGMELARTPLPLGEEGTGGVLTRYAAKKPLGPPPSEYPEPKNKGFRTPSEVPEVWAPGSKYFIVEGRQPGISGIVEDPGIPSGELKLLTEKQFDNFPAAVKTGEGLAQGKRFVVVDQLGRTLWDSHHPEWAEDTWKSYMEVAQRKDLDWNIPEAKMAMGEAIGLDQVPPYDKISQLPNGEFVNSQTGEVFEDLARARRSLLPPTMPKETPLLRRRALNPDFQFGNENIEAMTFSSGEGAKPSIFYGSADRDTIFHENLHGHFAYLGLDLENLDQHSIVKQIARGTFSPEVKELYGTKSLGEEIYAYAASAVRTGDERTLQAFADADTDKDTVLRWVTDTSKQIWEQAAEKGDSLHKRTLERKLSAVITRATPRLEDIKRNYSHLDHQLEVAADGRFLLKDGDTQQYFESRADLINHLDKEGGVPLNAPELVDTSTLPEGIPRLAVNITPHSTSRAPIGTDPPPPELVGGPIKAGMAVFSFFVRPFYDWLSTVSERYGRPDLYNVFREVDNAVLHFNAASAPLVDALKDSIARPAAGVKRLFGQLRYDQQRQTDFFNYISADERVRPRLVQEFGITTEEQADLLKFEQRYIEPMKSMGFDLFDYLRDIRPKLRDSNWNVESLFPKGKKYDTPWARVLQNGQLDPNDTNLLRVASLHLRSSLQDAYMGGPLKDAIKLINERTPTGEMAFGNLRPLLQRQIQYLQGVPDYTQKAIANVLETSIAAINEGLIKVNKLLPEGMQIDPIETTPREALQKYIMFSYAGGLALRPSVPIRDATQLMITTYPILGGKYLWRGMQKAFPTLREGTEATAFQEARQYGAFITRNDLGALYDSGKAGMTFKPGENISMEALNAIRWSHNSNRMIAFWGHQEKVADALANFSRSGSLEQFVKDSDAWFMPQALRNRYVNELQRLAPEAYDDFSKRMASDLVEQSQWNFRRGASPGLYKYQLGRLFGQYGTWPLNYIEYARRFVTSGDKVQGVKALTRLVLAHNAVLASGEALGIDTSHWVFTQPMAYGGGPVFNSIVNIPDSVDFQTYRGAEARRELVQPLFLGVPGMDAYEGWYKAVVSDDKNAFTRLLGFVPLEEKDKLHGWHKFIP